MQEVKKGKWFESSVNSLHQLVGTGFTPVKAQIPSVKFNCDFFLAVKRETDTAVL